MRDDDEPDVAEFISRNYGLMRRVATARLRRLNYPDPLAHADEVVAEACKNILSNREKLHSLTGAVIKITMNAASTFARGNRRRREVGLESTEALEIPARDPGGSPLEIVERTDTVRHILSVLSEEERTLFVYRHKYGMEWDEIAEVLGVSRGTLTSRYSRAKSKVQKALGVSHESSPVCTNSEPEDGRAGGGELNIPVTAEA
ncbi:MAG: sigma-70 family RNA polymerase sigma factor [Pyrinomonadaceae bacterium]